MKGLRLPLATAIACLSGGVHAQGYDPFDSLGSLEDADNPFGRDRNISVAERPRPAYATVPIRLGALELTPQIALEAGYDDNLFAIRAPRIGDAFVRVRPRVKLARPSPNLALSLDAEFDATRYVDEASENTNDYLIAASARYTIARATIADLRLRHGRLSEERTSPDSPAGVVEPNRFTISEAFGSVAHTFNRLRVRGSLDLERRDYRDGLTPFALEADQDFRDRTTLTGTAIAEYALSPSLSLFTAGSANRRNYRARIGPVPARDSSGYEVAAGASFELGRLTRGSLRLGYLKQDYRAPVFADIEGVLVRGELAYFMTPLVTLTGKIDRSISETGIVAASGYLVTTASLRADYELLRNLIIGAQAGVERRDFRGIDRKDDRFTAEVSAVYLVSPRVALRGAYNYRDQASEGALAGREFTKNRLIFGIVFKGL